MRLIRGLNNVEHGTRGCVATIGNFDGVHLGHKAIIEQVVAGARALRVPALVIVFEPQPREYFAGAAAPARLSPLRDKVRLLRGLGVDRLLCVRFDAELAALPAHEFVERLLVHGLGVRRLIVGDDFRFGRDRGGNVELLRDMGYRHGYTVERAATCMVAGNRVSSTRVRSALAQGDLAMVSALLGRDYSVSGRVLASEHRGAGLHLVIETRQGAPPAAGWHAVLIHGDGSECLATVGRYMHSPAPARCRFESRVLESGATLSGRRVRIEFIGRLRAPGTAHAAEADPPIEAAELATARALFARRAAVQGGRSANHAGSRA